MAWGAAGTVAGAAVAGPFGAMVGGIAGEDFNDWKQINMILSAYIYFYEYLYTFHYY